MYSMYEIGWDESQLALLDDFIFGYTNFETQKELAEYLGKSENAVKIRLSRRRKELERDDIKIEVRKLTVEEYIFILSNRFFKDSRQISELLNLSHSYLLEQLDELDCFECKEYLLENYKTRPISNDEYEIFIKLYKIKQRDKIYIAHTLNRPIGFIEEMIREYEEV